MFSFKIFVCGKPKEVEAGGIFKNNLGRNIFHSFNRVINWMYTVKRTYLVADKIIEKVYLIKGQKFVKQP